MATASSSALFLAACVFQACGGTEGVNKDGGGDGPVGMPDTGADDTGMGGDSGDMDTGNDTGADSGPTCTNTPCVVGLAVGGKHACALIVDGTVRCWGDNMRGQIGTFDGGAYNPANRLSPLQVDGLSGVTQVAASTCYNTFGATCAVTNAGGVLCLGSNGAAQLGLNAMTPTADMNVHSTPMQVAGLGASGSAGLANYMGCATTNTGEYWCWGDNGAYNGTSQGILGHGAMPNGANVPAKANLIPADAGTVKVGSPGSYFNLALTSGGVLYSWGDNGQGSLGRATMNNNDDINPAPVSNVGTVAQMSAGMLHACAVSTTGQVLCWGSNDFGQLGRGLTSQNGSSTPLAVALPGSRMAQQVSCSNYHTCTLATDGTVFCWGRNNAGQIGPNGMMMGYNPQPVTAPQQVTLPGKALAVGTGGANGVGGGMGGGGDTGYSCALIDGGSVVCWGFNGDGELGRTADAGGTAACANNTGLQTFSCGPTAAPVVWQ